MDAKDAKSYLTGLCLAALLTGGGFAAPGPAFGMGQSGCSTNGVATDTDNGDDNDNDDIDKEPDGNGA